MKVLFLTNNDNALVLYEWIKERCDACICKEPLKFEDVVDKQYDLIVSYNYIHIIRKDIIDYMNGKIINLHTSYLPWNRGMHPNFWSFVENTPKGVTIHQIDEGLDTGKILYQKEFFFDSSKETFETTYKFLNNEIVELFKLHWNEIKGGQYKLQEQLGVGSYHINAQLLELQSLLPFEWSENVEDFLKRYNNAKGAK